MAAADKSSIGKGLGVWMIEFWSAVMMIMCNKALMSGALNFRYPTTLTAAHFAWTAAGSSAINACMHQDAGPKPDPPPRLIIAAFVLLSSAAIILSNASLLLNSVAFYQIMKLATLPFVGIVEWASGGKQFTRWHLVYYTAILAGVGMTIVGDVVATPLGSLVATVSFMSAGLHQVYCARLQANYGLSPSKLLSMVSPYKAALLFVVGPLIDAAWFGGWIALYKWTLQAAGLILATCFLAIALNMSQYTTINLLGAGLYQALSQLKTVAVVVLGSIYFQGTVNSHQLAGTALTVCAVAGLTSHERRLRAAAEQAASQAPAPLAADIKMQADEEAQALLPPRKS